MGEPVHDYDPAESLETPEAIAVFLSEARKTGDRDYIAHAREVAERAKGMHGLKEKGR